MDIHRCRFVDFEPSAINALAFTHSSGRSGHNQPIKLAIGRANGDIELWNPLQGLWLHEITFRGGKDRSIEGLAWIQDPDTKDEETGFVTYGRLRLFSIGYASTVTEWNLITGLPLRHSSGSHSEVWCLAAQPKTISSENTQAGLAQDLVVGCADGSLVLLSTADNSLSFQKFIARASKKQARTLSLTFQDRNTLVAGFADSAIRIYDIRNGNLLRTMSLGAGPRTGPKEKLVWALHCLKDGTIVSGDSTGEIRFWDGKTYSQQQRVQAHEADVLCLISSQDGKTVMSGGIDRRTVRLDLAAADGQRTRWAKTAHSRYHKHDIKAMTSFENSKMSLVVSGGIDTMPMVIPIREQNRENHRALPYIPQSPPVSGCGRYLASWNTNTITIWRVSRKPQLMLDIDQNESKPNYKAVAQIVLHNDENIVSADLGLSGTLLVVSTAAETKLFRLSPRTSGTLKVSSFECPSSLTKFGSRIVQFSPDTKWLLRVSLSNEIAIFRILHGGVETGSLQIIPQPTILRRLKHGNLTQNNMNGDWGSYDRKITRGTFSSDCRILAISDLAGYIDTFVLEGDEDLTLPAIDRVKQQIPSKDHDSDQSEDSSSWSDSQSSTSSTTRLSSRTRRLVTYGQYWTQNPAGKSIPRQSSAPIVLSFRPPRNTDTHSDTSSSKHTHTLTNGITHKKKSKSHNQVDEIVSESSSADHLMVVTAKHEIHEYEVLKGRLTDWSRRNAANALPEEFRLQRDRAIGCVWDISPSSNEDQSRAGTDSTTRERLWLYGATWVCMFDLTRDFPDAETKPPASSGESDAAKLNGDLALVNSADRPRKRKRKRSSAPHGATVSEHLSQKKHTTGAGSKVPDDKLGRGLGSRTMRKVDEQGNVSYIDLDAAAAAARAAQASSDEDESDDEIENGSLRPTNGPKDPTAEPARGPAFYLTNRYRSILGIVPLASISSSAADADLIENGALDGEEADGAPNESPCVEVALIDRPFWDLELPPRFVGAHEWKD